MKKHFEVLVEVKPTKVQWSTPFPNSHAFQLLEKYFEPNYHKMKNTNLAAGEGYTLDYDKIYSMLDYMVSIN